nr:SDR family NAD(P)-dependent oxidoreductase [Escherichia coli]
MQGRRALITGAATGMGRATAELFSRQGAEIVLFGLGGEALDDAAKASGGRAVLPEQAQCVRVVVIAYLSYDLRI